MKFTYRLMISLFILIPLAIGGCSAATTEVPTPQPIAVQDGLGRELTLASPAQRVVSLAASNTEILYALGAGSQVVGRDEFSDYPAEASSLPSVGGSFGGYSEETIVGLNPDLILAAEINTPEQVDALEKLGLNVYWLANPTSMDGLYENLRIVGRLTGREAEAEALAASLQKRVEVVTSQVATVSERPLVFYELDATDPNAPYTIGQGNFINLLIETAGGKNAASELDQPWGQLSIEQLLVVQPEMILLGDAAYGVTPESVGARTGWDSLTAVKEGKIFAFDDNLVSRPGPRLVDGLEALAKLLHPGLLDE
jgi:iron complex transport system substrate-binding protein